MDRRIAPAALALAIAAAGIFAWYGRKQHPANEAPSATLRAAGRDGAVADARGPASFADRAARSRREAAEVVHAVRKRTAVVQTYATLAQLAMAGNSQASYQLFLDMLRCRTIAERGQVVDTLAAPTDGNVSVVAEGQIEADVTACDGLTEEQLQSKAEWAIRAARQGHVEAKLLFPGAATERFKDPQDALEHAEELASIKREALQHLEDAARLGNRAALFNLAGSYQEGTFSPRDPVRAYAYLLAYANSGSSSDQVRALMQRWRGGMTAHEVLAAERMSRSLARHGGP